MKDYDIGSMTLEELRNTMRNLGQKDFRAKQVFSWIHQKCAEDYFAMTDLPGELRDVLAERFPFFGCAIARKQTSASDSTVKYLLRLNDNEHIESVLMKYKYGYTLCVSTQVGCAMRCGFCATGIDGLVRNLKPSEMLGQVYAVTRDAGIRISHVVLMGMGEPLANFRHVVRFLGILSDKDGLNIGMRNVSLSTCGIVPAIYMLMERNMPLTLSVSLHAPNDDIRSSIMPINRRYGVDSLLSSCREYAATTSRRISFEYAMLSGVNDSEACAKLLAKKLSGMLCHVNLIPANSVSGTKYSGSSAARIERFASILKANGLNVTVRRSLGNDIDASCGQLRKRLADQI